MTTAPELIVTIGALIPETPLRIVPFSLSPCQVALLVTAGNPADGEV